MNIIVFGASGRTGIEVIKMGLELDQNITAYIRNPEKFTLKHKNLKVIIGSALDKSKVSEAIKGQDAVISCLAGDDGTKKSTFLTTMGKNIVDGMKENGVSRIAYMASAGIFNEIPGIMGKLITFILRNALKDHRGAVDYILSNNLNYTIARPMGLTDSPLTKVYRKDLIGIPKNGRNISRSDVAHFLIQSIVQKDNYKASVALSY